MKKTFRTTSIAETLFFLLSVTIISVFLHDGSRFFDVSPHPFWVIILLVSVQYGTREGLVSVVLSTATLLAFNIPERLVEQNLYQYWFAILKTPLMWFVAAVVLGQMRMRHLNKRWSLQEKLTETEKRERAITAEYISMKEAKEALETQLASNLGSALVAYHRIANMNFKNHSRFLLEIEDAIVQALRPQKMSLFTIGQNGFEAITCYGWSDNEKYIRRISSDSPIYKAMVKDKRTISIINRADEKILSGEGIIAAPLIDRQTNQVFGMVKIEDISFQELTLSNLQSFNVLCEWIGILYGMTKEMDTLKRSANSNIPSESQQQTARKTSSKSASSKSTTRKSSKKSG
jgi:hypothetical protein